MNTVHLVVSLYYNGRQLPCAVDVDPHITIDELIDRLLAVHGIERLKYEYWRLLSDDLPVPLDTRIQALSLTADFTLRLERSTSDWMENLPTTGSPVRARRESGTTPRPKANWTGTVTESLKKTEDLDDNIDSMLVEDESVRRQATVRYYSQMNPERMVPLLVVLSAEVVAEIQQKAVKQTQGEAFDVKADALLVIEPVLPGCDCYPRTETVRVTAEPVEAKFHVVPRVLGTIESARIVIRHDGEIVSQVALEMKVTKQTIAIICGILGLIGPYLMFGLRSLGLDPESQQQDGFPIYNQAASWFLDHVRPEFLGFALLALAIGFYFWMRPKQKDQFWNVTTKPQGAS